MNEQKHIIWSNHNLDIEDGWREAYAEFLEANGLDRDPKDEDAIYNYMVETNNEYLEDERINLNIQFSQPIIAVVDLGLWNGRHSGYKDIESGNIIDCLYCMNGYDTFYVDAEGDLRHDSVHHDGTNHILYRVFKEGLSEEQIEDFKDKIYEGTVTQEDINAVTERLGDAIAKVYGWDLDTIEVRPQLEEVLSDAVKQSRTQDTSKTNKEEFLDL